MSALRERRVWAYALLGTVLALVLGFGVYATAGGGLARAEQPAAVEQAVPVPPTVVPRNVDPTRVAPAPEETARLGSEPRAVPVERSSSSAPVQRDEPAPVAERDPRVEREVAPAQRDEPAAAKPKPAEPDTGRDEKPVEDEQPPAVEQPDDEPDPCLMTPCDLDGNPYPQSDPQRGYVPRCTEEDRPNPCRPDD